MTDEEAMGRQWAGQLARAGAGRVSGGWISDGMSI